MKAKTRKKIGSILVWGGLVIISAISLINIFINEGSGYFGSPLEDYKVILGGCIAILIGGLWGMRK